MSLIFQSSLSSFTFWKMHGCGNHFPVLAVSEKVRTHITGGFAKTLCQTHFSIGGDGIMVICPSSNSEAQFDVIMKNPDGSDMGMCGNGIRCVAEYVYQHDKRIVTVCWNVQGRIIRTEWQKDAITVSMGSPSFDPKEIGLNASSSFIDEPLLIDGDTFHATCLSLGNPHTVIFVNEILSRDALTSIGSAIENNPLFKNRTNVEFVTIHGEHEITSQVWERGAGITMACGSGACASVVAGVTLNKISSPCVVNLLGGTLKVNWKKDSDTVILSGPAKKIFEGSFQYAI